MYVSIPIAAGCLSLIVIAGAPMAGAQQSTGSGQQDAFSQIDQVVAYSTGYSDGGGSTKPDGTSPGDQSFGNLCENPDTMCDDLPGDLPMPAEGANDAMVSQGMLGSPCTDCLVDLLQYGSNNSIRIGQDGAGNAVSVIQDGDSNRMLGLQSGANNFIGLNQYSSGNFADISQYGDDHSIDVTQPGNGFILITQE